MARISDRPTPSPAALQAIEHGADCWLADLASRCSPAELATIHPIVARAIRQWLASPPADLPAGPWATCLAAAQLIDPRTAEWLVAKLADD